MLPGEGGKRAGAGPSPLAKSINGLEETGLQGKKAFNLSLGNRNLEFFKGRQQLAGSGGSGGSSNEASAQKHYYTLGDSVQLSTGCYSKKKE